MNRSEASALGVATAGHIVLFGLLSVGFLATPNPALLKPKPIEVVLADDVDLTSAAPEISNETPAERLAPELGPVTPPAPEPTPTPPTPEPPRPIVTETPPAPPRPNPTPRRPAPEARPQPPRPAAARPSPPTRAQPKAAPTPARPAPARERVRPTGRLSGITEGLSDRPSPTNATTPRASQTAAQARRSITVAIGQKIRPFWRPPTGADADQLVSILQFNLNQDGTLAGAPRLIEQRGQTDSNAPQQKLHVERAIRAIRAAAPFDLPPDHYDQWKTWRLEFDARLTQ